MIAILNMDKPERCDDCWALDDKYDYPMCLITQEQRGYNFNTMTQIMDKCLIIKIIPCKECIYNSDNTDGDNRGWCYKHGIDIIGFCSEGE